MPKMDVAPTCTPCEERKEGQCIASTCDASKQDDCSFQCKCVRGTDGAPDTCEPKGAGDTAKPPEDGGCKNDGQCKGECGDVDFCICDLKKPDPDQCMLRPRQRTGDKECQPGPLECTDPDVPTEDGHCMCAECINDQDCIDQLGEKYVCNEKRGEGFVCIPEIIGYPAPGFFYLCLAIIAIFVCAVVRLVRLRRGRQRS